MVTPKLTLNSSVIFLLRQKFENREVTGTEEPMAVWELEEIFRKHIIPTFRAQLKMVRKKFNN